MNGYAENAYHVTASATLHFDFDSRNKTMGHSCIDEHNIAERYLLDKLSSQERMRFEERLKNCAQCVNLLKLLIQEESRFTRKFHSLLLFTLACSEVIALYTQPHPLSK